MHHERAYETAADGFRLKSREIDLIGTIVNSAAIVAGSIAGFLIKGGLPKRYNDTVANAIGLVVIVVGLMGAIKTNDILLVAISLAVGSFIGEFFRIEDRLKGIGNFLEKRFSKGGDGGFSKGFFTASLLFCVGAMAVVGSLESGLTGNHHTLFTKSVLDGTFSILLTSAFGIGVIFSSVSVFLYQGLITLGASMIKDFLTPQVINEMSAVGGILIMAIGFNTLEIKKIMVGNMLPAIFLPLIYFIIRQFLGI